MKNYLKFWTFKVYTGVWLLSCNCSYAVRQMYIVINLVMLWKVFTNARELEKKIRKKNEGLSLLLQLRVKKREGWW